MSIRVQPKNDLVVNRVSHSVLLVSACLQAGLLRFEKTTPFPFSPSLPFLVSFFLSGIFVLLVFLLESFCAHSSLTWWPGVYVSVLGVSAER